MTRDPFVLVCARKHPFAGAGQRSWNELRDIDLITLWGASGNRRIVEAQLVAAGLPPRGRFVVESTPTALAMCAANVGVVVLPTANSSILASNLVEVPLIEPVVHCSVGLVHRRGETLSPAAASLHRLLQAELPNSNPEPASTNGKAVMQRWFWVAESGPSASEKGGARSGHQPPSRVAQLTTVIQGAVLNGPHRAVAPANGGSR